MLDDKTASLESSALKSNMKDPSFESALSLKKRGAFLFVKEIMKI